MKKLFVSLPMRGRLESDVRAEMSRLHQVAETTLGESLELIDNYSREEAPTDIKHNCWHLGQSVSQMAMADYVIFAQDWASAAGCIIEYKICHLYGIPYIVRRLDGQPALL